MPCRKVTAPTRSERSRAARPDAMADTAAELVDTRRHLLETSPDGGHDAD